MDKFSYSDPQEIKVYKPKCVNCKAYKKPGECVMYNEIPLSILTNKKNCKYYLKKVNKKSVE